MREVKSKEEGKGLEQENQHTCVSLFLVGSICEEWEFMDLIKYVLLKEFNLCGFIIFWYF